MTGSRAHTTAVRLDRGPISAGRRVAITEISKQQYDAMAGGEHCLPSWSRESEQAWYCDTDNTLIGVLLHFSSTGRWGHAICHVDADGQYRRIVLAQDLPSAAIARVDLVAKLRLLRPLD